MGDEAKSAAYIAEAIQVLTFFFGGHHHSGCNLP